MAHAKRYPVAKRAKSNTVQKRRQRQLHDVPVSVSRSWKVPIIAALLSSIVTGAIGWVAVKYQLDQGQLIWVKQQSATQRIADRKERLDLLQEVERWGREHEELASAHMMYHADWMEKVSRSTANPVQFEEWSQAHQQKLDELWHNWSFLLSALRRLKASSTGKVAATASSLIVLLERTSFHPSLTTADFEIVVTRFKQALKEGQLEQEKAKWLNEMIGKMELREYTRLLNELVREGQEEFRRS